MINHARTLLFNRAGSEVVDTETPGQELIHPTFTPLIYPSGLQRVQALLFGTQPDDLMRNYRWRQLAPILHRTEFEEFLLALDPRITYDVLEDDNLFDAAFKQTATGLEATTDALVFQNKPDNPDFTGKARQQFRVAVTGINAVRTTALTGELLVTDHNVTTTSGLSSRVDLPRSRQGVLVPMTVGNSWNIVTTGRPERTVLDLLPDLERLGSNALAQIFQIGNPAGKLEPYRTFKNCWDDHPEAVMRVGGLLLGWIYSAERVRVQ